MSLEVIAGASQMEVGEVERILEQEETGAQERVVNQAEASKLTSRASKEGFAKESGHSSARCQSCQS